MKTVPCGAPRDARQMTMCQWRSLRPRRGSGSGNESKRGSLAYSGLPLTRHKVGACCVGEDVYIIGGKDRNSTFRDVWQFNIKRQDWTLLELRGCALPFLQGHTAVAHKRLILIFGGTFSDSLGDIQLWIFNTDLGHVREVWIEPGSAQPTCRRDHSALVYNNNMYIYGGFVDSAGSSQEFWSYNIEEEEWTEMTSLTRDKPGKRHGHSAVVHNNAMWLYGGMSGLAPRSDLWSYKFLLHKWQRVKGMGMSPTLTGHSANTVHNNMVLVGGNCQGKPVADVWIFNFETTVWQKLQTSGSTILPALCYHAAVTFDPFDTAQAQSARTRSTPHLKPQGKHQHQADRFMVRPRSSPPVSKENRGRLCRDVDNTNAEERRRGNDFGDSQVSSGSRKTPCLSPLVPASFQKLGLGERDMEETTEVVDIADTLTEILHIANTFNSSHGPDDARIAVSLKERLLPSTSHSHRSLSGSGDFISPFLPVRGQHSPVEDGRRLEQVDGTSVEKFKRVFDTSSAKCEHNTGKYSEKCEEIGGKSADRSKLISSTPAEKCKQVSNTSADKCAETGIGTALSVPDLLLTKLCMSTKLNRPVAYKRLSSSDCSINICDIPGSASASETVACRCHHNWDDLYIEDLEAEEERTGVEDVKILYPSRHAAMVLNPAAFEDASCHDLPESQLNSSSTGQCLYPQGFPGSGSEQMYSISSSGPESAHTAQTFCAHHQMKVEDVEVSSHYLSCAARKLSVSGHAPNTSEQFELLNHAQDFHVQDLDGSAQHSPSSSFNPFKSTVPSTQLSGRHSGATWVKMYDTSNTSCRRESGINMADMHHTSVTPDGRQSRATWVKVHNTSDTPEAETSFITESKGQEGDLVFVEGMTEPSGEIVRSGGNSSDVHQTVSSPVKSAAVPVLQASLSTLSDNISARWRQDLARPRASSCHRRTENTLRNDMSSLEHNSESRKRPASLFLSSQYEESGPSRKTPVLLTLSPQNGDSGLQVSPQNEEDGSEVSCDPNRNDAGARTKEDLQQSEPCLLVFGGRTEEMGSLHPKPLSVWRGVFM